MTKTPALIPTVSESAYDTGYSQALSDYAIANVLKAVQEAHPTISQAESSLIAALVIEQLPKAVNSNLVSRYLHAIHNAQQQDVFTAPITLEYPQSVNLPNCSNLPLLVYNNGVKVRLTPVNGATEWGTLIGAYLAYACHRCCWMYRYVLWLDKDSPSAAWLKATCVWEDDIEGYLGEL